MRNIRFFRQGGLFTRGKIMIRRATTADASRIAEILIFIADKLQGHFQQRFGVLRRNAGLSIGRRIY
jgi:hypothetical protein